MTASMAAGCGSSSSTADSKAGRYHSGRRGHGGEKRRVAINAKSDDPDLAWEFVKFATGRGGRKWLWLTTGIFPAASYRCDQWEAGSNSRFPWGWNRCFKYHKLGTWPSDRCQDGSSKKGSWGRARPDHDRWRGYWYRYCKHEPESKGSKRGLILILDSKP